MEVAAIVCLMLFLVPVIAVIAVRMSASPWDEKRVELLERQVLNLHERMQEMEAGNAQLQQGAPDEAPAPDATAPGATPPPVPDALRDAALDVPAPEATPPDDEPSAAPAADTEPNGASDDVLDDGFFDGGDDGIDVPMAARQRWQPPSPERVAVWIGATVGALALAIGGLFLVATAIEAGLLGPGFRVGGAMAFGTLFWLGGGALRSKGIRASSALSAAGAATVFGATWAACDLYALLPVPVAFGALLVVVAVTMAQAARFHDRFLANLAVVGALLATFVIDSTSTTLQLGYALLLNTAIVLLVSRRPWPELLAVVGAGTALQVIGLTVTDLTPDRQPLALLGIGLLILPHAATVAFTSTPGRRWTALGVAAAYLVLAAPWTAGLSDTFYDLRSGLTRVGNPSEPFAAALGLAWLMAPLWLATRRTENPWAVAVATLAGLPAAVAFTVGWPDGDLLNLVVPVAVGVLGLVLFVGQRRAGTGLLPWLPLLLLAVLSPADALKALPIVLTVGAVVVAGVIGSFTSTRPYLPLALLPSLAIAAVFLGDTQDAFVVGPALAVYAALHLPLVVRRWPDPAPTLPWVAAIVAPVALMPGAYLWWKEAIGVGSVGVVPLLSAFWTLLVAIVLVRVHRVASNSTVFSIGVLSVLFGVTVAIPMQLEQRWLTISWALQGMLLAIASRRLKHVLVRGTSVLLGVVVAARLLVNPWALEWGTAEGWPVINWTLYTWGLPTVCLLVSAHFLAKVTENDRAWRAAAVVLRLLAMGTAFAMLNVQVSHAFQDQGPLSLYGTTTMQGMARSIVWGAYGLALLVTGIFAKSRTTRFLGFGFLMLSALKVFLLDVWSLPGLVRVGSLMALGMFLIVAAFIFERLVLRRADGDADEELDDDLHDDSGSARPLDAPSASAPEPSLPPADPRPSPSGPPDEPWT